MHKIGNGAGVHEGARAPLKVYYMKGRNPSKTCLVSRFIHLAINIQPPCIY